MKVNYLVLLVILTLNAVGQKDSIDTIPAVRGLEVPFEEIETNCLDQPRPVKYHGDYEWIIRTEEEYAKSQIRYTDYCRRYKFPEIDFQKYTLLGYHTSVGGCAMPTVKHKVFIQNRKLIFHRKITQDGSCEPIFRVKKLVLVPKMSDDYEIEFIEEQDCLRCPGWN